MVKEINQRVRNAAKQAVKAAIKQHETTVIVNQAPKSKSKSRTRSTNHVESYARDGYLATLVDPFGVHGMRIPDEVTNPSGVVSLRMRGTLEAIQDGTTGRYAQSIVFTPTLTNGIKFASTYSGTNITYASAINFPDRDLVAGFARQYRVVSAGLAIMQTNAMAANQGRNLCAFYPANDRLAPVILTTANSFGFLNAEITEDKPVNSQQVCAIRWHPSDRDNYRYHTVISSNAVSVGVADYNNPGQLGWFADGIAPTATFEYVIVLNIEFLPIRNTFSLCPIIPSFYDPLALAKALNHPKAQNSFGVVDPTTVMQSDNSNSWSYSSLAGELLTNFGSGGRDVLLHATRRMGQALAYAGFRQVMRNRGQNPISGVTGRPLPLEYGG